MAQKKEQYENFADSIFNFIFSANKKNDPPPPSRNIPGVSGDEMAYALGEIASAPSIYASEEALNVINEPLDEIGLLKSGEVKLEAGAPSVKIGISAKNVADFFNDPEGFVDTTFGRIEGGKKAAKQLNRIRGVGGVLDLGVGAVMARSAGLSATESIKMGGILGNERWSAEDRNIKAEELATRASALEAARAGRLNYEQANKQAQIFTSVMESSRLDLNGVDLTKIHEREHFNTKRQLVNKLKQRGITDDIQINEMLDKYADRAKHYKNEKGYNWNVGELNEGLTKRHSKGVDFSNPSQWIGSENPADKIRALKHEELRAEIALLPYGNEKIQKAKQLKHIETWQLSNGGNMKWSAYFGEASLNIQHFNDLVIKGGAFPMLINGDFFDKRKNNMTPSKEKDIEINGEVYEGIHVARDDQNSVYTRLNSLYYFTPASIGKTLFVNGEGFVYAAGHLRQEKIRKMIRGSDSIYNYVLANSSKFSPGLFQGINMSNQREVLKKLALENNYLELLKVLSANKGSISDAKLLKLLGKMENLQAKMKNSLALKYANFIGEKFGRIKNLMAKPGILLQGYLGKLFGGKLKELVGGGVITLKRVARGLAKKGVHALAQALGFATTGGLANVLIYAATEVIYFVSEKMLKPVFKIFALFFWSVGLILLMMLLGAISAFNAINPFSSLSREFDTASKATPIDCVQCGVGSIYGDLPGNYDSDGDLPGDYDSDGDGSGTGDGGGERDLGGPPPPEYSDADCPLGTGSINCSQGPYRGISHGSRNAIDVTPPPTTWYAPSDGVVTRVSPPYTRQLTGNYSGQTQLCGGIVHFYSPEHDVTYQLVHVRTSLSQGDDVSKGQLVVNMSREGDGTINFIPYRDSNDNKTNTCATGEHFHLELSGTSVYADRYYVEFLGCKINACRGRPQFEPKEIEASDEFKTFTGREFVVLGDSVIGVSQSTPPHITGNSQADRIIQDLAEGRGYRLRRDSGSPNSSASSAYRQMAAAIEKELGLDLRNVSHYRTVARQRELFLGDLSADCKNNNYANIINRTCDSAIDGILRTRSIPGYSKHHTGRAIDFGCNSNNLTNFGNTRCFSWLAENNYYNAKRFGFIPSYPAGGGNQGPDPEEWEYLWVGVDKLKK